eukprot:5590098-Pyramimonas_sp.AAC.1
MLTSVAATWRRSSLVDGLPHNFATICRLSRGARASSTSDKIHMRDKLVEHWAPIFTAQQIDVPAARHYVRGLVQPMCFDAVPPPTPSLPRAAAKKFRHSEPGLDGIPYSAWSSSPLGLSVLSDAMMWILSGQALFELPSDTLQVWLPKGDDPADSVAAGCTRSPSS